jgi:hypothetical protein
MTTREIVVPDWAVKGELVAHVSRPVHAPERIVLAEITGVGKQFLTVTLPGHGKPQRFNMAYPEKREDDGSVWYRVQAGYSGSYAVGPRDSAHARAVQHAQNLRHLQTQIDEANRKFQGDSRNPGTVEDALRLQMLIGHWLELHSPRSS